MELGRGTVPGGLGVRGEGEGSNSPEGGPYSGQRPGQMRVLSPGASSGTRRPPEVPVGAGAGAGRGVGKPLGSLHPTPRSPRSACFIKAAVAAGTEPGGPRWVRGACLPASPGTVPPPVPALGTALTQPEEPYLVLRCLGGRVTAVAWPHGHRRLHARCQVPGHTPRFLITHAPGSGVPGSHLLGAGRRSGSGMGRACARAWAPGGGSVFVALGPAVGSDRVRVLLRVSACACQGHVDSSVASVTCAWPPGHLCLCPSGACVWAYTM